MSEDRDVAQHLFKEAMALLDMGEFEEALEAGKALKRVGSAACFVIMAQAYEGLGEDEKALATVQEGVREAPKDWALWNMLGNHLVGAGNFAEAQQAYDRALGLPKVDAEFVHLNMAVLRNRQGQHEDALTLLEQVKRPDLELFRTECTLQTLHGMEKYREVAVQAAQRLANAEDDDSPEILSRLLYLLADATHRLGGDAATVREPLVEAVRYDRDNVDAFALLRRLSGHRSPDAKHFEVLAEGEWIIALDEVDLGEDDGDIDLEVPRGFYTAYDIIADSPEEAITFIHEIEPEEVLETLEVAECRQGDPAPDEFKGIYSAEPYAFYDE